MAPRFDRAFNGGHTYADEGTYTITVSVTDVGSSQSVGVDQVEVTVKNVAPTISLGGAVVTPEGSQYTLFLSTYDPGTDTIASYSIDWGDGSSETILAADFPANGQFQHLYPDGSDTVDITVSVTDEDGTYQNSRTINISNIAPDIALSGDATVDEGANYTLTLGSITDPGIDTVDTYIIRWGDGTSESIAAVDLPANGEVTHVYTDGPGSPIIVVDLVDEDGTHLNAGSLNLTVNNVAPTLDISGADVVDEGSTYTLTLSDIVDPGDDIHTITVDWGDGTAAETIAVGTTSVDHIFADGTSTPTISVTVADDDGASSTNTGHQCHSCRR